jgi:HAD superfamily hydrolase (TIGR01509 family)
VGSVELSNMIKAIFWDNDGVLVDTEILYYQACRETFVSIGIDLNEDLYIEYFLKQGTGTWHLAEQKGINEMEIIELRNERNRIYSNLLKNHARVINGAEETLKKLHGKFSMGVVTSSRKDHFEIIHGKTSLLKYFDFVLTSGDYTETKPSPAPYLKAVEKTGLKKEECIVIEDSERGLRAAISAGLRCYVIPTSLTEYSDFSGAEKILNNISDVPELLL